MGLQNDTSTTVVQVGGANTVGEDLGQSATDLVGFFGKAPVVQPTSASQAAVGAITDTSGGTSHSDTGLQALTSTYNSGIVANAISTLAANVNAINTEVTAIRAALVSLGLIKGS